MMFFCNGANGKDTRIVAGECFIMLNNIKVNAARKR